MFFQETTPDTSGYMIAGYIITFIILGLYTASMFLRNRNYRQDISMLEEMDRESNAQAEPAGKPPKKAPKPGRKKSKK